MSQFEKTYRPDEIEAKWYRKWEEAGAFSADEEGKAESYSIVIPPPNVTGVLHDPIDVRTGVLGSRQPHNRTAVHGRNVEDTRLGVAEYVRKKHNLETIELKWGQGAKCIGGEIKVMIR